MYDDRSAGRNGGVAPGPSSPGWAPDLHASMEADMTERQFLLSSAAHPAQTVGPGEMQLLIYTAARDGEVLLKVRYFGRSSSPA